MAYGTVLQEQRKALHERTGQAMEQFFHNQLEEHHAELAHHYQRSGNAEKAIEYLHLAGQQATQRSANAEAISLLTAALDLLLARPETPERAAQELTLRLALGPPVIAVQGYAAPEVGRHYARAQVLCAQMGNVPQRMPVLYGLWLVHMVRGELHTAQVLAEECLRLAEQITETGLLLEAYLAVGVTLLWRGEFVRARVLLAQTVARYQPQRHHALTTLYGGYDPGATSRGHAALALWFLGYPEQAVTRSHEALCLAQELGHPMSLGFALTFASWLHHWRGEEQVAQEHTDTAIALSNEHGISYWERWGTLHRGTALVEQGRWEEGHTQLRQGLDAVEEEVGITYPLAQLAAGCGRVGHIEEGLATIAAALRLVDKNDERFYEAELYRIKGELTLSQSKVQSLKSKVIASQGEAEACFLKAIEIARQQQAKS